MPEKVTCIVKGEAQLKSIPAEQAWFWTKAWQAGEREAGDQIAAGEGTVFDNGDSFLDSLR